MIDRNFVLTCTRLVVAAFYRVVTKANDNAKAGEPGMEIVQRGMGLAKAATMPGIIHETTEQTGILHKDGVVSLGELPGPGGS